MRHRIAMMGMILFPPLPHFYSFCAVQMRVAFGREQLPQLAESCYYLTFMIDVAFIFFMAWLWFGLGWWIIMLFV